MSKSGPRKFNPNYRMMLRIKQVILDNYKRLDMDHGVIQARCGTTGCFAGWACILDANKRGEWRNDGFDKTAAVCGKASEDELLWSGVCGAAERILNVYSIDAMFYLTTNRYPHPTEQDELSQKLLEFRKRLLHLKPGTKAYAVVVAKAIDITIEHLKELGTGYAAAANQS